MAAIELLKDISHIEVPADVLAEILDLTRPRIVQLANDHVLVRTANKKYRLEENLARYLRHLRGQLAKGDEDDDERKASVMLLEEKGLLEKLKRQRAEILLEKLKNRMHAGHDVELVMSAMLTNLRTVLLGLPSVLAPQVHGKSKEEIVGILNSAMEEALDGLKDYNPELFAGDENESEDINSEDG